MPIALTTSFNPGDHDPGASYPRAQIDDITISVKQKAVAIVVSFGDMADDRWSEGPGSKKKRIVIRDTPTADPPGTDFTDLMAEITNDGESIYDAIKRIAYAKLQAVESSLAGTIE
jgi:hypothetical protein